MIFYGVPYSADRPTAPDFFDLQPAAATGE